MCISEISRLYSAVYEPQLLEQATVSGGLKDIYPAQEQVWLLISYDFLNESLRLVRKSMSTLN